MLPVLASGLLLVGHREVRRAGAVIPLGVHRSLEPPSDDVRLHGTALQALRAIGVPGKEAASCFSLALSAHCLFVSVGDGNRRP